MTAGKFQGDHRAPSTSIGGRKNWLFWIVKILVKLVLSPFFALDLKGQEYLPKSSAFILLPKHQRWEDIPILALAAPMPLYYIAKYELFINPLSNWFLKSLGGLPLNRKKPLESRRTLHDMIRFLNGGEGVVVFPEGTYYNGKMGPGHVGIIRLILSRLRLPFIPVGIGYYKGSIRTKVRVCFGEAIYSDPADPPKKLVGNIMEKIADLSDLPKRK